MKCISIDREALLKKLRTIAIEAKKQFSEIEDIRIFGSLAKNQETGISDIDLLVIAQTEKVHPIERVKPYFYFFSERIEIGIDLLVAKPDELDNFKDILKESYSLL
ncbi:MAG: nucleotidyltransferase domain-containing protein [bacterium]|nr:nucleotidyltransferase domain-containing protein [bacterium]